MFDATVTGSGGFHFGNFRRAILKRSKAKTWKEAKHEWAFVSLYQNPGETCLCEHHPITDICVLENQVNGNEAEVGNCCVKRFMGMGIPSQIFACIKRLIGDNTKAMNRPTIKYFFKLGVFTRREAVFLDQIKRRRRLSDAQVKWRTDLNKRALRRFAKARAVRVTQQPIFG